MRKSVVISAVFMLLSLSATAQVSGTTVSTRTADIAAYAEKVRLQWKIPGMSLAVIHGDSTVLMQGFGVKGKGGGVGASTSMRAISPAISPASASPICAPPCQ